MIDFAHTLQPDIIINDRTGAKGDFDTPEQRVGGFQINRPWETCMNIANQWAWKPNDEVKSLEQCIQSLVRLDGGDGNLLFNVGPKPDGTKPGQNSVLEFSAKDLRPINTIVELEYAGNVMNVAPVENHIQRTTIGSKLDLKLPKTTAQKVRLLMK